ncbi:MAG: hypothetical protein M1825_005362 [Sarcosagium campestre]|nr:MAG: hypothetical protein M1825_005362 [Sarcosagium campestre]
MLSRPASAQSHLGPEETSNDAERQNLLSHGAIETDDSQWRGQSRYHNPTVESARTSVDSNGLSSFSRRDSGASSDESLQYEIAQMEVMDAPSSSTSSNSRLRSHLSKRITSFTSTLSAIHLPFQVNLPGFGSLWSSIPRPSPLTLGIIGRFFGIFLVVIVVYFLAVEVFPMSTKTSGRMYDPESVRSYVQDHIDVENIKNSLSQITAYDHIAGTKGDFSMAEFVEGQFAAAKLDHLHVKEYQVYMNYPRPNGRRVAITSPPELAWEAVLEEDPVYQAPDMPRKQTLAFHGYSRSGNVSGPLIYANYGSRDDFKKLEEMKIDVHGSVVLVRYSGSQPDRALKVKAAEMAGAVGCIIYSDPADDGYAEGKAWPDGPRMPSDGVERGSVALTGFVAGDALTPGWASTKDARRISKDDNPGLVNIPSLPLAWRDAKTLLQALKGHGSKMEKGWKGAVPEVREWWTGDHKSPVVVLTNEQDEEVKQPIWNVLGSITGVEQGEKTVIVGNHRDAWCFGAADPGSGTAILLEIVRVFGELARLGWRPLRTIQFASWDGEEYNLLGSTEWVEDNMDELRLNGVAYLNLDTAVTGRDFHAAASPVFKHALMKVLGRTSDEALNKTLRAIWEDSDAKLEGLGAGSDYLAFQDMAGTSSIDISFQGPGFPYHSCYDNFEWMVNFGDPGFTHHKVLAEVWALLILEMADRPVVPFDFKAYASAVAGYVAELESRAKSAQGSAGAPPVDMGPLQNAAQAFVKDANEFAKWEEKWTETVHGVGGFEDTAQSLHRMSHNSRMSNFDTHLLDLEEGGGLPGREQYKHVIFAPQAWSGYDAAYFPGVRDALDEGNWTLAQQQVDKAARILTKASHKLLH